MTTRHIGKYARLELERRYWLWHLPPDLDGQDGWRITDRYINGTRLRLRRMASLDGDEVLYKFGQKYRAPGQSAAETTMTNLYLDEAEYERLSILPSAALSKKRYRYEHADLPYAIDVFEGSLQGLILAEIECETIAQCEELALPPFAVKDVTSEPFFTGGNLVRLTREAFLEGLARRRPTMEDASE